MNKQVTNTTVIEAQNGSTDAANEIVLNMKSNVANWARTIAGKYHVEEATLEGTAALWEAVTTFDSTKGASFYTHASRVVRLAIFDMVANNNDGPTVHERTSRRYFALVREANNDINVAARMAAEDDCSMSVDTFWSAHRALDITERFDRTSVNESDDVVESAAMSEASQRTTIDVETTALNRVQAEQMLALCSTKESDILVRTYGLNGHEPHTDAETATALGISRPRVVTIRKAALVRIATSNPTNKDTV